MSLPPLTPQQSIRPPWFEPRIAILYAAIFAPMAIHLPYFPLWLEARSLNAEQIAIILAAPMFLRVISTPIISALADSAPERADVLIGIVAGTLVISLGYFLPLGSAGILVISVALAVFWTPHSPLSDSLALSGVRRFRASYPRMRIWGSIAFFSSSLAGGIVIAHAGVEAVPWMISGGLALALAASVAAPRLGRPRRPSQLSAAELPKAGRVVSDPYFLVIAGGCGLMSASHGFLYAFVSIYWAGIGIDSQTIGILWSIGVVAEVGFFAIFSRVFGQASVNRMLAVAAAAGILRWTAMPFIWDAGLGVPGFALVQTSHALTTGLTMLCMQKMIADTIPEERTGAAQGVAIGINGAAMALFTLASGPLYANFGADGFLAASLICAAALGLAFAARRLSRRR